MNTTACFASKGGETNLVRQKHASRQVSWPNKINSAYPSAVQQVIATKGIVLHTNGKNSATFGKYTTFIEIV